MFEKFLEWLLNIITNPLFVIGLLLVFSASILKDEKWIVSGKSKPFKLGKDKELRPLPNWMYSSIMIIGLASSVIGIIQVFIMTEVPVSSHGGVSLVSMKYMSGGWNPHQVDLRTMTSIGIPAASTFPLKFSEICISASPELAGSEVWAEFLANGKETIGQTSIVNLQPGITILGSLEIPGTYQFLDNKIGKYSNDSWDVQKKLGHD